MAAEARAPGSPASRETRAGVQITADAYPYIYSSTRLESVIPQWAHDGGLSRLLERLQDESMRARIAADPNFQRREYSKVLVANFQQRANRRDRDGESQAE